MTVPQMESQKQKFKLKRQRILWLHIGIFAVGLLLIGAAVAFNVSNPVFGVIALTALGILATLIQYVFPIPSDPHKTADESPSPTSQPIPLSITLQAPPTTQLPPNQPSDQHAEQKTIWNIPYRRNPYFTGRKSILEELYKRLTTRATALTQPQAISGLSGIGKTQIAVEYAYRHRNDYKYVLWVNAASREEINASFLELARLLDLPEKHEQDQSKIVDAVKHWLIPQDRCLLIFDNADDRVLVDEYLPITFTGHLLLTTRQQSFSELAESSDIDRMSNDEGTSFILRRTKLLAKDAPLEQAKPADRTQAEHIAAVVDGLPLALDQAAAYIDETHCSLPTFLKIYQEAQADILRRRGGTGKDHPLPVAATWKLSFGTIQQANPAATDLLRMCAFLAPDDIPEDMLMAGATELGPHLAVLKDDLFHWNETIATLLNFSLIRRTREQQSFSMHRLVQEVLRMEMDEPTRKTWAVRTIRTVNISFPDVTDFTDWPQFERYLPHALQCMILIDEYALNLPETASLLKKKAFRENIERVLKQLPPKYAICLWLYEHDGMSCSEIADILHISASAVKIRLMRARESFISLYKQEVSEL